MRVITSNENRRMPWKNGGGETTEIGVGPPTAALDAFYWRVSMARIDSDGPFSFFQGVDRTLAILEGDGLLLSIDAQTPVRLTADSDPFSFPGDVATHATRIGGRVTDLNVMTRRERLEHRVRRLYIDAGVDLAIDAQIALLLCLKGTLRIAARCGTARLGPLDTLHIDEPGISLQIVSDAPSVAFLVEINAP